MRVHLRMLGCRLNQSEIETMSRQFQGQGHELVDDPALADWIVVNTCAVTQDAARGSRQLVRQLNRANPGAEITVTGCYAQLAPQENAALPGVVRVVGNREKDDLVALVSGEPVPVFDLEPVSRDAAAGWAGRTRAFVKVQDGCDNACTFCVTTIARGEGRSRPLAEVVEEVRMLVAAGYREAVLTGVHLGSYGHDRGERNGLEALVRAILSDTDIARLRLSSLEPWDLSPAFFDLWQDRRLCRHLHLPLQSGCDATLRRMARRTTQAQFRLLVNEARARVPDMCITTDVIAGFPGETDEEFAISEAFIREMDFAGLHVFRYSKRPGTAAARMRGHVPEAVKKARAARLNQLAAELEARFAARFIGRQAEVLWEHVAGATEDGFLNVGYTDSYVRVRCVHPRVLTNHITPVWMERYDPDAAQVYVSPVLD
ncbi:MAG: tRNA (N(6)-L-threonylcarbamoyladenosine(37)-C(2))-methylthiotransferase MtaB [Chloroflexota bacterium]